MDEHASQRADLGEAIARMAAGDRDALKTVYRATAAKLFGVCFRILNDRAEAEDVLQDVYVTVWRKAEAFDPSRASPITWLVAIARNRAIDRARSATSARRMDPISETDDLRDPTPLASDIVETDDERRRLEACLQELDARQATAVRTAFFEGMTYEELAGRMGLPLGTMKSTIRRALMKLRACLER